METVDRQVTIATGYRTTSVTKRQSGSQYASSSRAGCSVGRENTYDYTIFPRLLRGERYAQVNYAFTIPANARNITWGVTGNSGCCAKGKPQVGLGPRRGPALPSLCEGHQLAVVHG